jgi:hypothetical protein
MRARAHPRTRAPAGTRALDLRVARVAAVAAANGAACAASHPFQPALHETAVPSRARFPVS